jgi:hypothetical protein
MAEDAGFEPARAINPTRVPGERHRPLGESSVAMVTECPAVAAGCTRLSQVASGQVLHSPWTPRGVYPVNSPRAGRQQGSMGSVGCAGFPRLDEWRPAAPGSAALAIATRLDEWRPAAPGSAALAIATRLDEWRPAAPGSAALAIATRFGAVPDPEPPAFDSERAHGVVRFPQPWRAGSGARTQPAGLRGAAG